MKLQSPLIAPSLLSADFSRLGEQVAQTAAAGAKYLHLDVMDGVFVPNITFGAPIIKALTPYKSELVFDTHLMITEPSRHVADFADAGSDIITVHLEACANISSTLREIRTLGKKAGLSIKPATAVREIEKYLGEFDLLLIMSVEPGFGGQKFIPESLEKIRAARAILSPETLISVDGGINSANAKAVYEAGADILVAGSAVYGNPRGIAAAISELTAR